MRSIFLVQPAITIFVVCAVLRVHEKVRRLYRLYDAEKNLGLQITEGPHKDTQELRIHAFVWFNRFLKGEDPLISDAAAPLFEPQQLKVFGELQPNALMLRCTGRTHPPGSSQHRSAQASAGTANDFVPIPSRSWGGIRGAMSALAWTCSLIG